MVTKLSYFDKEMASACDYGGGGSGDSLEESSSKIPIFRFHRRGSESSNDSPPRFNFGPRGFIRRVPKEEDSVEVPTFDRIRMNPHSGATGFVKLPPLPNLRTLTGLGPIPGIKSSDDEDDVVVKPTIRFPWGFENPGEDFDNQLDEEERINRIKEVEEFGKKLQKQVLNLYENEKTPNEFEKHMLREPITRFAKFALSDYSSDSYHYIWCILMDTKSIFKQVGDEENKDMILTILKMIRSKYIREGIPSGGAGGWELYEYTPI